MADSDDDGGAAGGAGEAGGSEPHVSAKAAAAAQSLEESRVTIRRALTTLVHTLVNRRGYVIRSVCGVPVEATEPFPGTAAHAVAVHAMILGMAIDDAALEHKAGGANDFAPAVLMTAEVQEAPAKYTTAWALGLPPGTKLMVALVKCQSVRAVRGVVRAMDSQATSTAIVLHRGVISPFARKEMLSDPTKTFQPFTLAQLQECIDLHCLNPPQQPLTAALAAYYLRKYKAEPSRFPAIPASDPTMRVLGVPRGSMVRAFERVQWNYFVVY
jgi:DNA-directed RNA polymerase subunit H (RpoH/RPB5)